MISLFVLNCVVCVRNVVSFCLFLYSVLHAVYFCYLLGASCVCCLVFPEYLFCCCIWYHIVSFYVFLFHFILFFPNIMLYLRLWTVMFLFAMCLDLCYFYHILWSFQFMLYHFCLFLFQFAWCYIMLVHVHYVFFTCCCIFTIFAMLLYLSISFLQYYKFDLHFM